MHYVSSVGHNGAAALAIIDGRSAPVGGGPQDNMSMDFHLSSLDVVFTNNRQRF